MKLISKHHDYYDGVLAQGRDESVVYLRQRSAVAMAGLAMPWHAPVAHGRSAGLARAIVANQKALPAKDPLSGIRPDPLDNVPAGPGVRRYHEAFVLVAGRAHPVWVEDAAGPQLLEGVPSHCPRPGAPALGPLGQALKKDLRASALPGQPSPVILARPLRRRPQAQRAYAHARQKFLARDFTALHLDLGAPVILLGPRAALFPHDQDLATPVAGKRPGTVAILNPCLADLAFARTLDPFSCFQAISQFIGGVVPGQQMPLVEISDKSKIQKRGFDPVYGFRTRPASA